MAIFNDKNEKEFRRALRRDAPYGERVLWSGLRGNKPGAKFRRQESIGPYVVDFYCPEFRLAIEVDGIHHEHTREYDSHRDAYLQSVHVTTIRFPDSEVISNSETVLQRIREMVEGMRNNGQSVRKASTQLSTFKKAELFRNTEQPPTVPRLKKAGGIGTGFLLAVLIFFGQTAIAQSSDYPPIPILHNHVLDETNSLSSDQAIALDQKLKHYEDSTSTQICIVLVPTLNGNPVEDYAVNVYDSNHIGQKNKNNGALILLAMKDHQGWITTGYGLEPTLTDAATSIVYQQILVPALREGNVYAGLDSATTAMFQIIGGEFKNLNPKTTTRGRPAPSPGGVFIIVVIFFVVLFFMRAAAGAGSKRTVVGSGGAGSGCMGGILQGLFWSSIFNSGRGGWGGGGFSGGGFGGFGGGGGFGGFSGGGGMTGGGGAGGGW